MVDQVSGSPFGAQQGGRKMTVKAMKRMLKKAGLKTTGKRAALTRRVKKAHLKGGRRRRYRGGDDKNPTEAMKTAAADLKAAVPTGNYSVEKQAALDAGWSPEAVEQVITDATPDSAPAAAADNTAAEQGGRRRRRTARKAGHLPPGMSMCSPPKEYVNGRCQ